MKDAHFLDCWNKFRLLAQSDIASQEFLDIPACNYLFDAIISDGVSYVRLSESLRASK
jgi:hypothetical protein